jgi:TRAP-type C4-dicarboxylate transport system permease small subunit
MKRLIKTMYAISAMAGALAAALLVIALILNSVEILIRSTIDRTLFITDEFSGYLMCGLTFLALAYTLREKGHIRMTIMHSLVKNRARLHLDTVCYVIGTLFSAFVTWHTASLFWDSVVTGSQSVQLSATYLAVPQFFMPFGALLLTQQFVSELLKNLLILRGDSDGLEIKTESAELGR